MEGDSISSSLMSYSGHFNPLPPHGGRQEKTTLSGQSGLYFNPLPPHGGRHLKVSVPVRPWHFNPLPPHGGRHAVQDDIVTITDISIHSLRMEGDSRSVRNAQCDCISIHSLRMEGDVVVSCNGESYVVFQSTPSAWRETQIKSSCHNNAFDFNPLPPHGGRQSSFTAFCQAVSISIRPLRMEGDMTPTC